jgi:DNA-binding response OmpR family regulator
MDKTTVLLVEDKRDLREVYETYLRDRFDVRTASDGQEALRTIDETVDVVLLDRRMPDMNGDEVLGKLRERGYKAPVAMVTGVEPDVDVLDLPFDEYLTKPVDSDELVNAVRVLNTRSTFDEKSREFFRLISKKASIEADADTEETEEYDDLLRQLGSLRAELNETIGTLSATDADLRSRFAPDTAETEQLLSAVVEHSLPDTLRELVEDYQRLEDARPLFMWKWVHRLAPQNELPCVDSEYAETVAVNKTLIILFITLLDDVLEKRDDPATFHEIAAIPSEYDSALPRDARGNSTKKNGTEAERTGDAGYAAFARRVWETLCGRLRKAPKYDTFEELFHYDIKQAINGVEYSEIAINRPDLSTMGDLERYESHNMAMFSYADVDLMYSSADVREDLSTIRDAVWTGQQMARIGNWVSTWERELREGDYSSGPVVYALETGVVTRDELADSTGDQTKQEELIERINDTAIEEEFLERWERHHYELRAYNEELSTMDLAPFIDGTEEILRYHLASTGLK